MNQESSLWMIFRIILKGSIANIKSFIFIGSLYPNLNQFQNWHGLIEIFFLTLETREATYLGSQHRFTSSSYT